MNTAACDRRPTHPAFPRLPDGFQFGAATAAYQIEGAVDDDGRGPSIWDTFSHTPDKVARGETGDVACDHYHRYREDAGLLRDLGVDSYRFSIAWPRIQPTGTGRPNQAGLDFYKRLLDELSEAGIHPMITLYHWDLPQALQDHGGWPARDTAYRFADYAAIVAAALRDLAPRWITLNEPFCSAFLGYAAGSHAPGAREGTPALAAAHHLLLGHGLTVTQLREHGATEIGVTLNLSPVQPASNSPADQAAAARAHTLKSSIFTDPLLTGRLPDSRHDTWGTLADDSYVCDGDLDVISAPLDFLGVNYYRPIKIAADARPLPSVADRTAMDIGTVNVDFPDAEHTGMGWPVEPDGLRRLLIRLRDTYPHLPPVYITENGIALDDAVNTCGHLHDSRRVNYLAAHLGALRAAIDAGVDVRGYYAWSLIDNFEWAHGYDKRFGLVHIDYDTQTRTPKDSFWWYRDLITTHHSSATMAKVAT